MRHWFWCVVAAVVLSTTLGPIDPATAGAAEASALGAPSAQLAGVASDAAGFVSLTPARILDTRPDFLVGDFTTPWGPGETRTVDTAGLGGVPATGVQAVAVNVTTVDPTADSSWLTVFATGATPETTAALNFGTGPSVDSTTNDLIVAKVNAQGQFDITNEVGSVTLVIDVIGYFVADGGSGYFAVTPDRIIDSRPQHQVGAFATPWAAGQTRTIGTAGLAGLPFGGVEAVAVNVTTVSPTAQTSWMTIHPTGSERPLAASSNFGLADASVEIANDLVIAKVNAQGQFDLYNARGSVDVVIDVVGFFAPEGARFVPLDPARIIDTRPLYQVGPSASPWAEGETRSVAAQPAGVAPGSVEAVVVNVTTVNPTAASSWLTAFPPGEAAPTAASLNFGTDTSVTSTTNDVIIAKVDENGEFLLANEFGSVDVVIDIVGYFASRAITPGEFRVVSPIEGSTVTANLPVVVEYSEGAGISRIEVRVEGETIATLPDGVSSLFVPFVFTGSVTVEFVAVAPGQDNTSQNITLEARPDLIDPTSIGEAFRDGVLSVDEYLLAALPIASGVGDPDAIEVEESTMAVFSLLQRFYAQVTPETREALREMASIHSPSSALGAAVDSVDSAGCGQRWWALGLIVGDTFCEITFTPTDPSLTPVRWFIAQDLLDDSAMRANVEQSAERIWLAQKLFESPEYGFELPEPHRNGIPITLFVVDEDGRGGKFGPAFSSPFQVFDPIGMVEFGNPIRVNNSQVDDNATLIHELFHTFEWNDINYALDVLTVRSPGRTVAFYESAANWGTQEYLVEHHAAPGFELPSGYNLYKMKKDWLDDPTSSFLEHPDWIWEVAKADGVAYSFFPALTWLDEHARANPTGAKTTGFIRDMLAAYGEHFNGLSGKDPWDVIRDQVDNGQFSVNGDQKLAAAWPRMWAALYLMKDQANLTPDERDNIYVGELASLVFESTEVTSWRDALSSDWRSDGVITSPSLSDSYGRGRPARKALVTVTEQLQEQERVSIQPGGAAFYDFEAPAGTGFIDLEIRHDGNFFHDRFEVLAMQFTPSNDLVLCGEKVIISPPDSDTRTERIRVTYSPECPKVTLGITNVNLDSGFDFGDNGSQESFDVTSIAIPFVPQLAQGLEAANAGHPYAADMVLHKDSGSFTFTVAYVDGLTDGLTIDSMGSISGTPVSGGFATIEVGLDVAGTQTTQTFELFINGPILTDVDLPNSKVGDVYFESQIAAAASGAPVESFVVSGGALPPGISLLTSGTLSGTPIQAGDFAFEVTATDANEAFAVHDYAITIIAADDPGPQGPEFLVDFAVEGPTADGTFEVVYTITNLRDFTLSDAQIPMPFPANFDELAFPSICSGLGMDVTCVIGSLAGNAVYELVAVGNRLDSDLDCPFILVTGIAQTSTMSGDGTRLAFIRSGELVVTDGYGSGAIVIASGDLIDPDTGETLTYGNDEAIPFWGLLNLHMSEDGTRFSANRNAFDYTYVFGADTFGIEAIVPGRGAGFSDDGTTILTSEWRGPLRLHNFVSDSTLEFDRPDSNINSSIAGVLSGDGSTLAAYRYSAITNITEIAMVDASTGVELSTIDLTAIAEIDDGFSYIAGISDDGQRVLYVTADRLYVIENGEPRDLGIQEEFLDGVRLSGDGTKVLYFRLAGLDLLPDRNLNVIDVDSGELVTTSPIVAEIYSGYLRNIEFSNDGTRAAFFSWAQFLPDQPTGNTLYVWEGSQTCEII